MKKLFPLLSAALIVFAAGCGGGDDASAEPVPDADAAGTQGNAPAEREKPEDLQRLHDEWERSGGGG